MIRIVSFKICPFVQRVTAMLEAKDLPYQVEYISLQDKPQWFLDLSPNGQVPILITENGTALFESEAIAEYIEDAYGPLTPGLSAENRALTRAWGYLAAKTYLLQCSAQRAPDIEALAERSVKMNAAFDKIEKQLTGKSHFFDGDQFGWVDAAWLVLLHRAAIVERHSGYDFVGDRPKLKRWQRSLMASGFAEKSVAEDFEAAFAAFYLSEDTALRRCDNTESCCAHRASPTVAHCC